MLKQISRIAVAHSLGSALLAASAFAQDQDRSRDRDRDRDRDDYAQREPGQNAGGNWLVFETEDRMTAARLVRFELTSDNTMPDSDRRSKVVIVCKNGKYERSDFIPSIRMGGPNRPGFWGQPQMEVRVRVDKSHHDRGWNWYGGRYLSMDKGTTRELLGAHIFRVEFLGRRRQAPPAAQIAEFSPDGLDVGRLRHACDLTPKHP